MKPRSTLVLIPLTGARTVTWETMIMLRECDALFSRERVRFGAIRVAGFDQAQARAELLARFIANTEFEDALFVDSDVHTIAQFVLELAQLEEPLLVVPYRTRGEGALEWAIDTSGQAAYAEIREGKTMIAVQGAGLGFTRIRRGAVETMLERFGNDATLNWTSHHPETLGLPVCGLFDPIVHEFPRGSGTRRRRPEDMSFFVRAREAGLHPYALVDVPCWHDMRGGDTFLDAQLEQQRKRVALRRRVDFELAECPDDLLGLAEVLDGAYDIHSLELRCPRILDIGANIGAFAVWASGRFVGAEIDCYEPHPRMVEICAKNTGGLDAIVKVHACAVVGYRGRVLEHLHDGQFNQGERSVRPVEGVHKDASIEVPAMWAGDLPPCDVLKVDTEGCEREILEAYPHLEGVKAIMTEWHSGDDYVWLKSWLRERGFQCVVDRARGRADEDRELCFVRRGVLVQAREIAS